jgi:hypothetical protein
MDNNTVNVNGIMAGGSTMKIRVLVCGGRNWSNESVIRQVIDSLPEGTVIIEGAARGADSIAGKCARERGLEVLEFPANWNAYGKSAGFIRNRQMLEEGKPHIVVGFHENIAESKGTKDMLEASRQAGLPTFLVTGEQDVAAVIDAMKIAINNLLEAREDMSANQQAQPSQAVRVIHSDILGDVVVDSIMDKNVAVRVLETVGRIARLQRVEEGILKALERVKSKKRRAELEARLDAVRKRLAHLRDALQAMQAEFPAVNVVDAAVLALQSNRRNSEMYVNVAAPVNTRWLGNAMLVPVDSEFGKAMVALLDRREKRLPEPAGFLVDGTNVLLVSDELILQLVAADTIALSASYGTVTGIGLLLLAGKDVSPKLIRQVHLAVRKRFRNYSVTAYNSIGVGAPGLAYTMNQEPVPDVAEVGVPVRVLDRLCVLLGRPDLRGTELAWLINNGFASALLSKMPPTHGTRSETVVRVVPISGIEGGLLLPNETAKRHFSDFDGDTYKLFVRIANVHTKVGREKITTVKDLFLRGLDDKYEFKITALSRQIGLDVIAHGKYGHMMFNGLLALIGAEAKNLVAPVATGALAVIAWLAAVDKTGISAIRFANRMLPLFEPLFDARKGLAVDIETVRKGMPFAHAVVKLLGVSTPHQAAEVIREIGAGADQFFGEEAGIGHEMRQAAAIIEEAMNADAENRLRNMAKTGDAAKLEEAGGLSVKGARTIQAMAGTKYNVLPADETPMVTMFNGGPDEVVTVPEFGDNPVPIFRLSLKRITLRVKYHPKAIVGGEKIRDYEVDANDIAAAFGFQFSKKYVPAYGPVDYRRLDNNGNISAKPVDAAEMFPNGFRSYLYRPEWRFVDGNVVEPLERIQPNTGAATLHQQAKNTVVVVVDRNVVEKRVVVRFRVLVATGYYDDKGNVRNAFVEVLRTKWLPRLKGSGEDVKSLVVEDGRGNLYAVASIIEPRIVREKENDKLVARLEAGLTHADVRVAEVLYEAAMEYLGSQVRPVDKGDAPESSTRSLLADFGTDPKFGARKLNNVRNRIESRLRGFLERCQELHPTPGLEIATSDTEVDVSVRDWPTARFARHLVEISPALSGGRGALTSGCVTVQAKAIRQAAAGEDRAPKTELVEVPVPPTLDWVAIGEVIDREFAPSASRIVAPMKDGANPFVVIDIAKPEHIEDVGATFAAATWYRLLREKLPDKEVGIVHEDGTVGRGLTTVNVAIIDLQHANLAVLDGKRDSTETMFASGHFKPVVQVPHSVAADEKSLDVDLRREIDKYVAKVGVENVFLCTKDGGVLPYAQFKGVEFTEDVLNAHNIDYYISDFRIFNEAEPQRRFVVRIVWRYAQSVQKVYFTDSLVKGATLRCDGVEFSVNLGGQTVPIDIVSSEDSFRGKKAAPAVVVGALRLVGQVRPEIDVAAMEAEMNEEFYRLRDKVNELGLTGDELEQLEHELLAVQAQRVINLARKHGVDIVTAPLFVEIDGTRYELGRAVVARLRAMMVNDGSIDWSNVDPAAHISLLQHILHNCTCDALKATGNDPVTHDKFRVHGDEPEVKRGNAVLAALRQLLNVTRAKRRAKKDDAWWDGFEDVYFEDDGGAW